MTYYKVTPSYFRNPGPVYPPSGDYGAPFPGWGTNPNMAGPARLGVGAVPAKTCVEMGMPQIRDSKGRPVTTGDGEPVCFDFAGAHREEQELRGGPVVKGPGGQMFVQGSTDTPPAAQTSVGGVPWWVWIAAPVAVGGVVALGYNMGWFGKA